MSHPAENGLIGYTASPNGVNAPDEGLMAWTDGATYSDGLMSYQQNLAWTASKNDDCSGHWGALQGQLSEGYPVVVEVQGSIGMHWVLVTSFNGGSVLDPKNYSINDPGNPNHIDFDPNATLANFGNFYAMRVYHGSVPKTANLDVVEVIDHSGSMGDSSGAGSGTKLDAAKDAADMFVDMLNVGDKIGVVGYSDTATVDYPLTAVTSGRCKPFSAIPWIQRPIGRLARPGD